MKNLDSRITDRIRGPAWSEIRDRFAQLCDVVLAVAPSTRADLTTIYVKFTISQQPTAPVYAVAWLKTAKNVVIGFALPHDFSDECLTAAPPGMSYKGITKYYRLSPSELLPDDVSEWARIAFDEVNSGRSGDGD